MIDDNLETSSRPQVPHPSETSTLPIYMLLFLFMGMAAFALNDSVGQLFASMLAATLFACFLILFAVYWTGWLLRGHAAWNAQGRQSDG